MTNIVDYIHTYYWVIVMSPSHYHQWKCRGSQLLAYTIRNDNYR